MPVVRILSVVRTTVAASAFALILGVSGCKKAAPADDASLSAAVQSRIAGDGALSAESIQSSVQSAVATLNGTVSSDAARSLAAADAAQVPGIKTVVNNLTVQTASPAAAAVTPLPAPIPAPAPSAPKKILPAKVKSAPVVREQPPVETAQTAPPPPPPPPVEARPSPPPPPPQPTFRDLKLPAGTEIPIRITQTLDSATTQQGDTFTGTIATDVFIDNVAVLRQGTPVAGRVSAVQEAAHYKGNSLLTVELTSINRHGERLPVATAPYSVQGKGRGKNTAEKVGGGAAVGAILGGIFGGGKGAAIGAAAGGGVGAGANTVTRGEQVQIPSETLVRFQLSNPVALRVATRDDSGAPGNPELQQRPQNQQPQ